MSALTKLSVPLLIGFVAGWWCAQPTRDARASCKGICPGNSTPTDFDDAGMLVNDFTLDERMFCAKFRGASTPGGLDVVREPPPGAPRRCLSWTR